MRGKGERYLVIEEVKGGFRATVAKTTPPEKEIRIVKTFEVKEIAKLKKLFYFTFDKIVLALDRETAATVQDSCAVQTSSRTEIITEAELENLVFKGLWEFLNKYRSWASKKLNVSDVSLILNDVQVRGVKLDGHKLFNPVGFKGGSIEFTLKGTFITRQLMSDLAGLGRTGKLSIIERNAALASFLEGDRDVLVSIGEERTATFLKDGERQISGEEIAWGVRKLKEKVSEEFSVDYETAGKLIGIYAAGLTSVPIGRRFKKIITDGFNDLLRLLGSKRKNFTFYFESFVLPSEILQKDVRADLCRFDEELSRRNLRITAGRKAKFDLFQNQGTAILLTYSYVDERYDLLNIMLRRRAGWLVSHF
ncbi:hypothetical protein M1413_02360 [Patescibacteria group bacterium]|nr:hypothetical protein [Patescibacteria group bacterium]MCL5114834.1 hypothetical protein [Patescibacteria group bacterium]